MKTIYSVLLFLCITSTLFSQTFEFSISYVGINPSTNNYQMVLLATPNATVTDGNTSDMGAGFYVPTGLTIGNFVTGNSNLPASEWSSQSLGATNANGDSYFISRVESGANSILLNGANPFELVFFDIIADPNPTEGNITFVENGDPIFNELLFIENYMNINLGSGTVNAYSQNNSSANSFQFNTLSLEENQLLENSISIYPNPSKNVITLKANTVIENVEIYDITGKSISKHNTNTINIQTLNSGIYLLKIQLKDGIITKRIIKE